MATLNIDKVQARVILAVTFGNILEWFEIYLYALWAPIMAKIFFCFDTDLYNLISVFVLFGAGFLARPIGAIIFGRLGDIIGRKRAFTLSITLLSIPTFIMGLLPTYAQIGLYAPLLMGLMRILQSFPAAGEAPGAFCYLYENANSSNKKFMTSWGAFGNQVGAILSVTEYFIMKQFMSDEFLISWGWRISFLTGGLLGLLGIYLRRMLRETPLYARLQDQHKIHKTTLSTVLNKHQKKIWLGTAYGILNAASFYLIASYIPTYFNNMLGLKHYHNLLITLIILVSSTILLPIFGIMGDKYRNKPMLIASTLLIVALLPLLYISINNCDLRSIAVIGLLCIIPVSCITALLPYLLTHLFPTSERFTGVALSFNLADGIIGGFSPAIALYLLHRTTNQAAFCWLILLCAVVTLISYCKIKE